jgi:hypothetical protein
MSWVTKNFFFPIQIASVKFPSHQTNQSRTTQQLYSLHHRDEHRKLPPALKMELFLDQIQLLRRASPPPADLR